MSGIIGKQTAALAVLGVLLAAVPAAAQLCEGLASFSGRPVQFYGAGGFKSGSRVFAGGVSLGSKGGFLNFESGTTQIDAFNRSAHETAVGMGYQVALNQKATAQLCPLVNWTHLWGPDNVLGTGLDYNEQHSTLGAMAGFVAARRGHLAVIPTAALALMLTSSHLADTAGHEVASSSMMFGLVGLGVGLVLDEQVTIRPALEIPVGGMDGPAFQIMLGVNFGKGH